MKTLTYRHTQYASYLGYVTQAIVNNLLPLLLVVFQEQFQVSLELITLLISTNFCIQLAVDFLAARVADRIGYRLCIVSAHLFSAAGLIGLAVFPHLLPSPYLGLLTAVFFYAIGGGLIEVLISPIVEACPTENKASVMSLLHSFYCWGTVGVIIVSTIFLSIFGKENWHILVCLWAVLPTVNAIFFTRVPIAKLTEEAETMSLRELLSERLFWIFVILMIASGASEQAMSQWASSFAEKGLGVSKAIGDLAGPCLFSVLMGCSRVFYAKFSERINLLHYMIASGILCIAAYLLSALSSNAVWGLVGCGLCGLSVGILWPGVFSTALARCRRGGTAMFAYLALAGDLGCAGGPAVVGTVAGFFQDQLRFGLLAALIFPIALITGCLFLQKRK